MKIIGLTGGIGTGKSTVSSYLRENNCYIIDADQISRSLTAKGGEALPAILEHFGKDFFFDDGTLNRKKLGAYVFDNPEEKKELEKMTTLVVIEKCNALTEYFRESGDETFKACILDAPLLFEFGLQNSCDESWLVVCEPEIRLKRVMERDGLSIDEIKGRIRNQMSDEDKIKLANRIIDNSKGLSELYEQLDRMLECL